MLRQEIGWRVVLIIDHDNLKEFHDPANDDLEKAANAAPRSAF
jgi:hypothetical protein